jgi:hypothetical protein
VHRISLADFGHDQVLQIDDADVAKLSAEQECYNCVTTPRAPDRNTGVKHRFEEMIIKLTNAERDTILAALRRWQSFPAAREADLMATNGGKHRPLDNSEIERICKRMTRIETRRDAPSPRQSNNGAHERKASKAVR